MRLATIRFDDGEEIPCVLRDLSPTGAKLAVSRRYRLPASFYLIVHGREIAFPVRRAWQRGDLAGVMLAVKMAEQTRIPPTQTSPDRSSGS
ncbi:PilZ domain-containing protein [Methylobacterium sp. XJLW]|uniref:PilZ domain-containing protein n=1 Tax=Methylobacterium sp. XJLW TaxID=739141 RepID=UPI003FA5A439